ncbi:uncharacterized protein LOC110441646 isoform X2 [Mizuhopecten yessoensis]|uniref:uncharacterized protein LOC110441646 isoform X2 n=1 Tax=Mizuhopecten yessoensis TaxID=6573 RepID=UPI000B459177|nr:uncharacterized protein LOC110441646 isoform X2 [Mizuhopecten yessoensis]
MASGESERAVMASDDWAQPDMSSVDWEHPDKASLHVIHATLFKVPSWEKDINNLPDERRTARWPFRRRNRTNEAPINIIDEPPINLTDAAAAINIISERKPISMTVSTKKSEERGRGRLDPYEPSDSSSMVKSLYDACKSGDKEKRFKQHANCPELFTQNSILFPKSRNIDGCIAAKYSVIKEKRKADNKSLLQEARRSDKSSLVEITRELNKYEIYDKDEKEHKINKTIR